MALSVNKNMIDKPHVWQKVARFWRAGQVAPGEHAVLQLLTDSVTLVQGHGRHFFPGRSWPGLSRVPGSLVGCRPVSQDG
jgi:hypothetical protein